MGYRVIWLYDGCPYKDATILFASLDRAKDAVRYIYEKYGREFETDPKLDIGIKDLESGRLVSFSL
jgi:hypothetical protein